MQALIQTLLNYASIGQEPIVLKKVGMPSVVDAVVTMLQPTIDELRAEVPAAICRLSMVIGYCYSNSFKIWSRMH